VTKAGIKARRDTPIDVVLAPGNGKKLTEAEALAASKGQATATSNGTGDTSATDKAKAEEVAKKNAEITATNTKIENANKVVGDSFKAGNAALMAGNEADRANKHDEAIKLYGDAVQQYDTGIAADPEHPGIASLLTNKSAALRSRGVDKYNLAITTKDEATKTPGMEGAKADFTAAAETANRAVDMLKKQTPATDPAEQKQQATNKYFALNARAEALRLFVPKVDPSKADDAVSAYQEYIAAEPDAAKKSRAQIDLAQMLLDAGAADKAAIEFQKIVAEKPDDPDANLGLGLALFLSGDKGKYQEAANYLQKFVNTAPDTHRFKNDAKAVLQELKNAENVTPEKTTTRPATKKRP
jgi:tetratricopeptide (TPR) repeat protein